MHIHLVIMSIVLDITLRVGSSNGYIFQDLIKYDTGHLYRIKTREAKHDRQLDGHIGNGHQTILSTLLTNPVLSNSHIRSDSVDQQITQILVIH